MELYLAQKKEQEQSILPSIPEGYVRLTHFTRQDVAEALISGSEFKYDETPDTTCDSHIKNNEVEEIIQTGKKLAMVRTDKGDCVVIIDVEAEELSLRNTIGYSIDKSIPNSNILGYVKRSTRELKKNTSYKPRQNDLKRVSLNRLAQNTPNPVPIPTTSSSDQEIW